MNPSLNDAVGAVWRSLSQPHDMAAQIKAMQISRNALWTGLALAAVLNVLLLSAIQLVSPMPPMLAGQAVVLSPFAYTSIIGIFLVIFSVATYQTGRFFGGNGSFDQTLAVIVWFQAVSLALEVVQFVLVFVAPFAGALFSMISIGALIWVYLNFINVLHSFQSFAKTAVAVVLSLIVTGFGAGIILALLGIG